MVTEAQQLSAFRIGYLRARAEYSILPLWPMAVVDSRYVKMTTEATLNVAGLPQFGIPVGYDVQSNEDLWYVCEHEAGHAFLLLLARLLGLDPVELLSAFATYFHYPDGVDINESWAAVFVNSIYGMIVTTKSSHDETIDPFVARAWFHSWIGGTTVTEKARILLVAGHNNAAAITEDGLCDGLDKAASAAKLRAMTGANGEAAYVGDFVQRLAKALNDTGLVEARFTDCTYHADLFSDWKPTLVHAAHFHRDADTERAMFACPDPGLGYYSDAAHAKSQAVVDYCNAEYEKATGIPVTPPLVTLGMRQLYTWCYIDNDSLAFITEIGNANVDHDVMYSDQGMAKIVEFHKATILKFTVGDPTPAPARDKATIIGEIRARLDELEGM